MNRKHEAKGFRAFGWIVKERGLVENEIKGDSVAALVELEEMGQGLSLLKRDEGEEGISGEGQIECGPRSSMPVAILLPS